MERMIGTLFETLAEPDWASGFLAEVCAETRSHAAAILQVDVRTRRQTLPAYYGQGSDMAAAFELPHAAGNPWRPPDESKGPPAGAVVVPDDDLPLARLRKTAFWADFLRPMNVDHGGGVIGLRDAHQVISLTLLRSSRRGPYDARERDWLARLAPHWVNACALRARLAPDDGLGRASRQALDCLGTATFFLDEHDRCIGWNSAADELLRDGGLVRLRGGRLVARAPGSGAMFAATTRPTVLRRPDGSTAGHATAHALPGHGALGRARTAVFVEPTQTRAPERLRRALMAAYALTAREAELAVWLADGLDLSQVAATMGVSTEGVRTRLKVVYGKTGVRNQSALVSLVKSLGR